MVKHDKVKPDGSIGSRLRDTLNSRGLSLASFASKSGIAYRSLQNYVAGEQNPGAEALLKIKEALGLSIDWLLTGEGSQFIEERDVTPRRATIRDIVELRKRFSNIHELASSLSGEPLTLEEMLQKLLLFIEPAETAGRLRNLSGPELADEYMRRREELEPAIRRVHAVTRAIKRDQKLRHPREDRYLTTDDINDPDFVDLVREAEMPKSAEETKAAIDEIIRRYKPEAGEAPSRRGSLSREDAGAALRELGVDAGNIARLLPRKEPRR